MVRAAVTSSAFLLFSSFCQVVSERLTMSDCIASISTCFCAFYTCRVVAELLAFLMLAESAVSMAHGLHALHKRRSELLLSIMVN